MAITRKKVSVKKFDPFETKAYILRSKSRMGLSIVSFLVLFAVFILILAFPKTHAYFSSDLIVGITVVSLGGLALLIPSTEEWVYNPWQDATQKYDKSFYD